VCKTGRLNRVVHVSCAATPTMCCYMHHVYTCHVLLHVSCMCMCHVLLHLSCAASTRCNAATRCFNTLQRCNTIEQPVMYCCTYDVVLQHAARLQHSASCVSQCLQVRCCVAACCSVLQCVAVCCSMLQCISAVIAP